MPQVVMHGPGGAGSRTATTAMRRPRSTLTVALPGLVLVGALGAWMCRQHWPAGA